MALRAYIGTSSSSLSPAKDVTFSDDVKVREVDHEGAFTLTDINTTPIQRDPILVLKYQEAMKQYKPRGFVDYNRRVSRKNQRQSENRINKVERGGADTLGPVHYIRTNEHTQDAEEDEKSKLSRQTYVSVVKKLKIGFIRVVYDGLNQETFSLKYHQLDLEQLRAACIALRPNMKVCTLDLTGVNAGDTGAAYVSAVLKENLYILDLTLADNGITTDGLIAICDALKENRTLRCLSLAGNKFSEQDAQLLKTMMVENTTLKSLNLSRNHFHDIGGCILADGLEENDAIEDLDLSWNHLRQKGAKRLIEALVMNTTVKRADLSYNGFHDAVDELARLLQTNTTLTYLDLTSNRLGDNDMPKVVQAFKKNETLTTLVIGKNPYTAPFCFQLLQIVHDNPRSKIKELDFDSQPVDVAILDLIQKTREQRQLYINHGVVLKASLQREATDDFENSDPLMVLMEIMSQRQIKLVDLFQSIDKDNSKTITRTELREGLHSLNIPMSGKAIDKLMRRLDVDENGVIDFAEFMEGQREYLEKKKRLEEHGPEAMCQLTNDESRLKEKVARLIKMRKLAKMAQVLDNSTAMSRGVSNTQERRSAYSIRKASTTNQPVDPQLRTPASSGSMRVWD